MQQLLSADMFFCFFFLLLIMMLLVGVKGNQYYYWRSNFPGGSGRWKTTATMCGSGWSSSKVKWEQGTLVLNPTQAFRSFRVHSIPIRHASFDSSFELLELHIPGKFSLFQGFNQSPTTSQRCFGEMCHSCTLKLN